MSASVDFAWLSTEKFSLLLPNWQSSKNWLVRYVVRGEWQRGDDGC